LMCSVAKCCLVRISSMISGRTCPMVKQIIDIENYETREKVFNECAKLCTEKKKVGGFAVLRSQEIKS
jgi:hypothetical protein